MIQPFVADVKVKLGCSNLIYQYASTGNTMIEKLFNHLNQEIPEGLNLLNEDGDIICKRTYFNSENFESVNIDIENEDADRVVIIRVFLNGSPLYFISASDDSLITIVLMRYS